MARRSMKVGNIVVIAVVGFAGLVAVDHFVLKGKLGISGRINQLIGQIRQLLGQGAGPITAAPPIEGAEGYTGDPALREEQLMAEEEMLAAEEPETAAWARARRRALAGRRTRRRKIRLGGYGI